MSRTFSVLAPPILIVIFAVALAGCGENSSVTTITGSSAVILTTPTGPNTTTVTVDSGPSSAFLLGLSNVLYVPLTACATGSSNSVTIDPMLVDSDYIR